MTNIIRPSGFDAIEAYHISMFQANGLECPNDQSKHFYYYSYIITQVTQLQLQLHTRWHASIQLQMTKDSLASSIISYKASYCCCPFSLAL